MATSAAIKSNVMPIKVADTKESEKKWGVAVMKVGYCILPSILLRAQARLLINAQQMNVLLQLIEHWWTAEGKIYPSKDTIAERVGLSAKQVQRHIKVLEEKGLLRRIPRVLKMRGKTSNEYDLSGLVAKLKAIEVDFREAKRLQKAAAKPGGIKAAQVPEQKS
jgi:DNA-binding transcriptional MocR family regulator